MEAKVWLRQVMRLAQELEQCEKKLSSNIERLDALCKGRCSRQIKKKMCEQSETLKKQASLCKDLAAVLEQAVYLYEKTEESVIQAAETDPRRYEETLRAVSLVEWTHIPVTLDIGERL